MAELMHSAQSFRNAEDAIIVKKKKKVEWVEVRYIHHLEQGPRPKKAKMGEKRDLDGRKARSSSTWPSVDANQGWPVLEIAKEDERRPWQAEQK